MPSPLSSRTLRMLTNNLLIKEPAGDLLDLLLPAELYGCAVCPYGVLLDDAGPPGLGERKD